MKILLGLTLVLLPVGLSAQTNQPAHCHGVVTSTLASGHEHRNLDACAAQVAAQLPAAIADARSVSDTARLMFLHRMTMRVRDPAIFSAGLDLAKHAGATAPARVLGLYIALGQLDPGTGFYSSGVSRPFYRPLGEHCEEASFYAHSGEYAVDHGVPSGAEETLRLTATNLRDVGDQPFMVRRFANCVLLVLPDPSDAF
jgi:hypothetical protein